MATSSRNEVFEKICAKVYNEAFNEAGGTDVKHPPKSEQPPGNWSDGTAQTTKEEAFENLIKAAEEAALKAARPKMIYAKFPPDYK
jgi:PleD family two-component response regulator